MSAPTAVPAQQVVNFSWEAQPSVMDRARPDARAHDEMRELTFSTTSFTRSDGSVRLSLGGTTVLAAVTGPIAADASREDPERAFVDVTVRLPVSGPGAQMTTYEMSIANTVASVFSAAIALDAYPRSKITITLHVLSDAGSLRAACINAATAAALDAALPCLFAPAAAEVALIDPRAGSASSGAAGEDEDDKANAQSGSNLSLVLDPHSAEEADALGRILIVAAPAPATVLPPAHPDAPPAAVSAAAASTASAAAAASSDAVNGPALVAASKQMTVVSAVATGPWPPALWLSALSAATTACAFVAAKNRVRAGEAADARGVTVGAVEAAKKAAEAAAEQALTKMATKGQA